MSQAASQAAAFYREVASSGRLWTIRDARGFPRRWVKTIDGRSRSGRRETARKAVVNSVGAYTSFLPVEIAWGEFCDRWAPGLERDGLLVGVNWSGPRATGYDIEPGELVRNVESARLGHNAG